MDCSFNLRVHVLMQETGMSLLQQIYAEMDDIMILTHLIQVRVRCFMLIWVHMNIREEYQHH